MAFFYILQSLKAKSFYTGSCDEINARLKKHNSGSVRSTKAFRPWELVYKEHYKLVSKAKKREYQVKSWKSRKAIEKLILNGPIV